MAYTFNGINNLLDQQQSQNNNNIFNQGSGASQGGDAASSGGDGSSSQTKTSTEGEVSSGGGSSGTQQAPKPAAAPKVNSGQAILQKAKNTNLDTGFSKNLVSGVQKSQQDLENEANQYTQAQQGKAQQNLSKEQIQQAESGEVGDFSTVSNLLKGPSAKADQFSSGISSRYQDIDNLSTQGGLQNYLQKHGNENYNSGQAALDSLLLSRDKNYQNDIQAAKAGRSALQSRQSDLEGNLTNQVQGYLDQKAAEAKNNARGVLSQDQQSLLNQLNARVGQYNQNLESSRKNAASDLEARKKQIIGELASENPALSRYLQERDLKIDPMAYYKANNNQYNIGNVAEQGEAQKYNRIMDLLGTGGQALGYKQNNLKGYDFDEQMLRDALKLSAENELVTNPYQDTTPVPGMWEARQKALQDLKDQSRTKRINGLPIGITNRDYNDLVTNTQNAKDIATNLGFFPTDTMSNKANSDTQKVAQELPDNDLKRAIMGSTGASQTAYNQTSSALKKQPKVKF